MTKKRARTQRWLSSWTQREFARRQLYLALAEIAPEALADLEERGLQRLKDADVGRYAIAPAAEWPRVPPLGPFARTWARSHNLDADWVAVDAIGHVLALWNGEIHPGQHIMLPVRSDADIDEDAELDREIVQVEISLPPLVWHLSGTPRARFEEEARQAFEAALSHRLDAIERAAGQVGYGPFDHPSLWRNVAWIVQRDVLRRSWQEILGDDKLADTSPEVVNANREVKKTRALLGLPPARRGRPPARRGSIRIR